MVIDISWFSVFFVVKTEKMTFVGTLIKNSTRTSYQYKINRNEPHPHQNKMLENLLNKGKKTGFGKIYNFSKILESENVSQAYSDCIPIYTYERLYKEFLKYQLSGSKQVVWKGETTYYALTSGTTEGGSKKIPVSDCMIKQFQKTSLQQLIALHELSLPPNFFKSSVLTLGGSTKLTRVRNHWEGDLSGILQKNKSLIYKLFTKPGNTICAIKDWNEKLDAIVKEAKKWDIGVIAGSPVWVNRVLQEIVTEYKVNSIQDIWPNLRLFLHGGVFLNTYESSINKLCNIPLIYLDTYLTSEGYFAYQKNPEEDGMHLLTNHGVYYEFVEEKYFDFLLSDKELHKIPTLTLREVECNKKYALIISTSSGLWRYCIGDILTFTAINPYLIKILGRLKHTLNMVGEHVSMENMNNALQRTNKIFSVQTEEYCVVPAEDNCCHHWYIGSNQTVGDTDKYASILDLNLEELNDDYKSQRKYNLAKPKVTFLPLQKFYEFLEKLGKTGGQHKFPRVLNKEQAYEWEVFLSRLD